MSRSAPGSPATPWTFEPATAKAAEDSRAFVDGLGQCGDVRCAWRAAIAAAGAGRCLLSRAKFPRATHRRCSRWRSQPSGVTSRATSVGSQWRLRQIVPCTKSPTARMRARHKRGASFAEPAGHRPSLRGAAAAGVCAN
eukprot:2157483-Prymnesium_polylepis.1